MKKTTKKKLDTFDPVTSKYTARVKTQGRVFTQTGSTVSEAISKLTTGMVRGIAVLVIEKDEKRKERVLSPVVASRLFNGRGTVRELAIRNTSQLFEDL